MHKHRHVTSSRRKEAQHVLFRDTADDDERASLNLKIDSRFTSRVSKRNLRPELGAHDPGWRYLGCHLPQSHLGRVPQPLYRGAGITLNRLLFVQNCIAPPLHSIQYSTYVPFNAPRNLSYMKVITSLQLYHRPEC